MAYGAASTVNAGLSSIGGALTGPSALSQVYDKRNKAELRDLERRKLASEDAYRTSIASAKQAEVAQEANQAAILSNMPQVDVNGSDEDIVKQARAQYIYLNNNGLPEEAKQVMSELKNVLATGEGGGSTLEEKSMEASTEQDVTKAALNTATAEYTASLKSPVAAKATDQDFVALQEWLDSRDNRNIFEKIYKDPEYNVDILLNEAKSLQQSISTTERIDIIEAARRVLISKGIVVSGSQQEAVTPTSSMPAGWGPPR